MAESKTTKPRSRGAKLPKKAVQEAFMASIKGETTQEHLKVLQTIDETPEATLGLSRDAYQRLKRVYDAVHGEDQELLVVAQALMLCGLPYKPVPGSHHIRQAKTPKGTVRLTVTATDPETPLPYGKDRVVLSWVCTKAMRNQDPVVTWESTTEFFELFGIGKGGNQYRLFRESWRRLAQATFKLEFIRPGHESGRHAPIFERWDFPSIDDQHKESTGLVRLPGMNYSVELGSTMWAHLRSNPVPLRLEVMREFQDEPKAWDFVGFVCWRSWLCEQAAAQGIASPTARISFSDLLQQLGSVDKDHKQLRRTLKSILERLGLVWPEMRAQFLRAGVLEIQPPVGGLHLVKSR